MYRAQILLQPEQHRTLAAMARREGRSLSDLVREIVETEIQRRRRRQEQEIERRLEALERAAAIRRRILSRRRGQPLSVDGAELMQELREERDEELLRGLGPAGS